MEHVRPVVLWLVSPNVLLMICGSHIARQARDLIKMADNTINACMEQRGVMRFLVNEGMKPADLYRKTQTQYAVETFSCSKTFRH